ncbi:MAG: ATP-binding cassette domain-containing protein [Bacteroidetes bacterium]|nr:ATP-binding cassette domain-containing protein [Bacteroidota bacterium]
MTVHFMNTKGKTYTQDLPFPGFMGWIKDWDLGGTYTDHITCENCNGSGLKKEFNEITLFGYNIHELSKKPVEHLAELIKKTPLLPDSPAFLKGIWNMLEQKISFMVQTGLSYIHINRFSSSLSAGEAQRIKLTTLLGNEMNNIVLLLDEPTRGLHSSEINNLTGILKNICKLNNTLIVVEHDSAFIRAADHIVELGPGPGIKGGEIIAEGNLEAIHQKNTISSKWLLSPFPSVNKVRRRPENWLKVNGAIENNLKVQSAKIPLNMLVGICGVSGSGKSTLIIDTIARALIPVKQTSSVAYEPIAPGKHDSIEGAPKKVVLVDQSVADIVDIAGYLGIDSVLHAIYLESEASVAQGFNKNIYKKSCSECKGKGIIKVSMEFLSASHIPCESCGGTGYAPEAWVVKINDLSLPELFLKNVEEIYHLWKDDDKISSILENVIKVGLGYLVFQQPPHSLSSGEAQRLKLAMALNRKTVSETLYILDEPTVGLHNEDVQNLIDALHELVKRGNSVWVVEHHLNILASCDYLIEMGPKGGPKGGKIIAEGTPEFLSTLDTPTAKSLKSILQ